MSALPALSDIDVILFKVDAMMGASEAHGALCGMFCACGTTELSARVDHVLGEQEGGRVLPPDVVCQLSDLHRSTLEQLNDAVGEFHLLLPGDNETLVERVCALASWCQGFVYGLAAGGITEDSELPDDTRELLRDFIEISRAGHDADSGKEDDEQAFMEISEYVRMGILLINEELQPLQISHALQ